MKKSNQEKELSLLERTVKKHPHVSSAIVGVASSLAFFSYELSLKYANLDYSPTATNKALFLAFAGTAAFWSRPFAKKGDELGLFEANPSAGKNYAGFAIATCISQYMIKYYIGDF